MKVKVLLPFDEWKVGYYDLEDGFVSNGKLVVVGEEQYGLVINESNYEGQCEKATFPDQLDVIHFWLQMDEFLLDTNFKLNNKAFDTYRTTRGNGDIDRITALKKIKRNLLLAYKSDRVPVTESNSIVLQYGYLRFVVYKDKIVHISKADKIVKGWIKNTHTYKYYSKLLNVE